MKNIFFLNIKTFYTYKVRILIFTCFLLVLSFGISFLATQILEGDSFLNTIYIGILDLDDGMETRMIISAIESEEYGGLIEFVFLEENFDFENSNLSAVIVFPPDFGHYMVTGRNMPFNVIYNENSPIASSVIMVIADAFTEMLRLSQIGIYTAINYSNHIGDRQNEVFIGSNLTFLGFILNRADLFEEEFHTITGTTNAFFSYISSAYIFLMICGFFVFTDVTRKKFTIFTIKRLKNENISSISIYFGTFLAYFVLFILINIPLFFTLLIWPIIIINIVLASFATLVSFLFKNELSAGIFVSLFSVFSLFFSGGIVPIGLINSNVNTYFFSYYGVRILGANFIGESMIFYSFVLLLFWILFSGLTILKVFKV